MKKFQILVVSAVLLSVGNQFAAEEGGVREEVRPGGNPAGGAVLNPDRPGGAVVLNAGGFGGKSAAAWYIEGIEKSVKLTPEQKDAMTKIMAARDKAAQEFQTKNADKLKAAMQAMTEAYKTKDKDAIAKAQKDYQEASAETSRLYKQAQTDLENVLTPEQKAKRQEQTVAQTIKSLTEPAVLTAEQTAQIKSILAKQNTGGRWREGGERGENRWHQSIQDVLTADQKATIAKHRALSNVKAMFGRVNLTADQLHKIEATYDELVKTPNVSSEGITKKLYEKVNGLLTEEQKEAMKKGVWTGLPGGAVSAGGAAPGQRVKRRAGSPQVIKPGEGKDGLSLTINGENVRVAQGGAGWRSGETIRIGEGRREMEKGPWLGLAMEPVSDALRAQLSLAKGEGLLVSHVVQSSPANRAGLAQYDILLRLDDQILVEPAQLRKLIAMKKPGDHVKLVYMRKAERKETTATLIEHVIESFEHAPLTWSQVAPGQPRSTEHGNREVIERLEQLLRNVKEKPPGAPMPQRAQPLRLNPAPGAALPLGASPPRLNAVPPREH
jgi:Spy/CpxP family protein refolding chaperone